MKLQYFTLLSIEYTCESNKCFFCFFFFEIFISKTADTIYIKKIERNHGVLVYKKALISEYRKNYIFRDINYFVKMSVSTYITKLVFGRFLFSDNRGELIGIRCTRLWNYVELFWIMPFIYCLLN